MSSSASLLVDEDDDAAIEAFVRRTVELLYHPVGTVAMGGSEHAPLDFSCASAASRACAWPTHR